MKNLINRYKSNLLIWIIGTVITIWLSSLLTPVFDEFNKYLIEKSNIPILRLITFLLSLINSKIPVYSIIIFFGVVLLLYRVYRFLILRTRKFKILKAEYGSGTTFIDITNQLNNFVENNKLYIPLKNSVAGLDPTPGVVKVGKIQYELNGKVHNKKIIEGRIIDLP